MSTFKYNDSQQVHQASKQKVKAFNAGKSLLVVLLFIPNTHGVIIHILQPGDLIGPSLKVPMGWF